MRPRAIRRHGRVDPARMLDRRDCADDHDMNSISGHSISYQLLFGGVSSPFEERTVIGLSAIPAATSRNWNLELNSAVHLRAICLLDAIDHR